MPVFRSESRHARPAAVALSVWMLLNGAPARAQEPSPTELAVARRLFEDATDLERMERWELAASKLREAVAIKDTPGLRFHLAHCEENMGQLVEALLNYERARDLIAGGAKAPDVEALLEPARLSVERRLPTLVLVTPVGVKEMDVEINGRPMARSVLGRPAPVNPGTHRILVKAPGYRDFLQEISIGEGLRRTVSVELQPIPLPAAPPPTLPPVNTRRPDSASASGARTFVLLGEAALTVAAAGMGVAYRIEQESARDRIPRARRRIDELGTTTADSSCNGARAGSTVDSACRELHSAINDYDRARFLSAAGFVGAGVGAVSIVLTLALWPKNSEPPRVAITTDSERVWFSVSGTL